MKTKERRRLRWLEIHQVHLVGRCGRCSLEDRQCILYYYINNTLLVSKVIIFLMFNYCLHITVEPVLGDLWFGQPLVLGDHNHWHGSFLTKKYLA